jgi:hypothetical protein
VCMRRSVAASADSSEQLHFLVPDSVVRLQFSALFQLLRSTTPGARHCCHIFITAGKFLVLDRTQPRVSHIIYILTFLYETFISSCL